MFSLMVVEDSQLVRRALIDNISKALPWLEIIGEAEDGISGEEKILSLRPDIVLTDIRLPGQTGLKMIRNVMHTYAPEVIVISGYSEFEYARDALSLGVLAYIVKPVDENELQEALKYAASRLLAKQRIDIRLLFSDPDSAGDEEHSSGQKSHHVLQAMRYIHNHYAENFPVGAIADTLGISEDHLGRLFKEQTSFSINEYRNNYRMAQAAKLLARPELSVSEVAQQVGMNNQHYFSILFKQKMGLSPSQYRSVILSKNTESEDDGIQMGCHI